MLRRPFLTALDERVRIKGSRDPLGVQSIWVSFARHVIGNLTTVSSSVRDFTTHLLGAHFAHELKGTSSSPLDVFLRWEQLAAYARVAVNKDGAGLRGIEQVQRRLDDGEIRISSGRRWQILSDQKTYGLWGLYTGPASQSGLVESNPLRPTDAGHAVVAHYESTLQPIRRKVIEYLDSDGKKLDVTSDTVDAIARVLTPRLRAAECNPYDDHLVRGGPSDPTKGVQALLADLIIKGKVDGDVTPASLRALAKQARQHGGIGVELADRLERIVRCDALIAPATNLFGFLLDHDGDTLTTLAAGVAKAWKRGLETTRGIEFSELRAEILSATSTDLVDRWDRIAAALGEGDFETAIREALAINAEVMKARGSAPWMSLDGDRLRVGFRPEPDPLLPVSDLRGRLRFPYFLSSLIRVTHKVRGTA